METYISKKGTLEAIFIDRCYPGQGWTKFVKSCVR